jgi:hypothetical protein
VVFFVIMPSHESQTPYEVPLPVVTPEIMQATTADFSQNPEHLVDSIQLMQQENPVLTESISRFIQASAETDDLKARQLATAAALVYMTLRSQTDADSLNELF